MTLQEAWQNIHPFVRHHEELRAYDELPGSTVWVPITIGQDKKEPEVRGRTSGDAAISPTTMMMQLQRIALSLPPCYETSRDGTRRRLQGPSAERSGSRV